MNKHQIIELIKASREIAEDLETFINAVDKTNPIVAMTCALNTEHLNTFYGILKEIDKNYGGK